MTVVLNGDPVALADGTSLVEAVATLTDAPVGVAVAVDGEVVPRSLWPGTVLRDGAVLEVVTAVQGG